MGLTESFPAVRECLIVFARYPEIGKVKTRLIPALGAEAATSLYKEMAEHTLEQARTLRQNRESLSIQVWFTGGNETQMQAWLGNDLAYHIQIEGDLGDRMAHALQSAIAQGYQSVAIVGTDCPELDAKILDRGFRELQEQELVLGPAKDGGYYLIGLQRFVPELFAEIPWSTSEVFQRTVEIAERLGLTRFDLPSLSDIDTKADVAIWECVKLAKDAAQNLPRISVVIPALNEAENLPRVLKAVRNSINVEIILVDGGSADETIQIAESLGAQAIAGKRGRAAQMNLGATVAKGEILLFLHADTILPNGFDRFVRQTLQSPNVVAGAFELGIDSDALGLRWIEWGVKLRSHLCQMPYGDQVIFLKTSLFRRMGGFPELPIMEDFELVRRLKRQGRIAIAPASVLTSSRRWQKLSIVRTTLINQAIVIGYYLGIPPSTLAKWYRDRRK
ncbi:TIGR04283 family arsenosugar biosynthesis glycosyltransferase [Tumidithrix elongata RA019]|uniref:4,4'-diaponeurosporenoate glycosyltransferase n=1 Tax=Tumidithrix elongata BACA0141 TaxID=2716417 RepID=A0AAW9Q538_9CYAN|nr:TIGR04283 family arsenosugar biosynthesis glycosyltransferase [Tumidithrix elongata RA019]